MDKVPANQHLARISQLEQKLYRLIKKYEGLQKELQTSIAENLALRTENEKQKEALDNFQNTEKITNLVLELAKGDSNTREIKQKLDDYITYIDRCIEQLNNE